MYKFHAQRSGNADYFVESLAFVVILLRSLNYNFLETTGNLGIEKLRFPGLMLSPHIIITSSSCEVIINELVKKMIIMLVEQIRIIE